MTDCCFLGSFDVLAELLDLQGLSFRTRDWTWAFAINETTESLPLDLQGIPWSTMFYLVIFGCTGSLWLHGLSLVLVSGGYSLIAVPRASCCGGFSCCGARALGRQASVVVEHGLKCPKACEIFTDQGWKPCPCIGRWTIKKKPLEQEALHVSFLVHVTLLHFNGRLNPTVVV